MWQNFDHGSLCLGFETIKHSMIDLNCKGLTHLTLLALPFMKEGGRIVEFGSIAAFQPIPYIAVYGATKAYVLSYSRALNRELKSRKISVTWQNFDHGSLCLGFETIKHNFFAF